MNTERLCVASTAWTAQRTRAERPEMFDQLMISIAPSQRWTSMTDPNDVNTIERSQSNRWIVRTADGNDHEVTGAAIRARYVVDSDD